MSNDIGMVKPVSVFVFASVSRQLAQNLDTCASLEQGHRFCGISESNHLHNGWFLGLVFLGDFQSKASPRNTGSACLGFGG